MLFGCNIVSFFTSEKKGGIVNGCIGKVDHFSFLTLCTIQLRTIINYVALSLSRIAHILGRYYRNISQNKICTINRYLQIDQ
jgi:hypothetical protein